MVLPSQPDRADWRLDGRTLQLSLSLATSVSEVKNIVQRATNMPTAKQKLQYEVRPAAVVVPPEGATGRLNAIMA